MIVEASSNRLSAAKAAKLAKIIKVCEIISARSGYKVKTNDIYASAEVKSLMPRRSAARYWPAVRLKPREEWESIILGMWSHRNTPYGFDKLTPKALEAVEAALARSRHHRAVELWKIASEAAAAAGEAQPRNLKWFQRTMAIMAD